jgi:hypothetical protein
MKTATMRRTPSTDQGTFGALCFGASVVHSVELPWRDNRPQRSCIPPGAYRCQLVKSPRFGRVYGVQAVPGRSAVLIHSANLAGDIDLGYTTQLHGCIAPAMRLGALRNNAGHMQAAGMVSRPALAALMDWAGGEPFTLEISE